MGDSGLLLVDKPRGVTSFDAVAAARAALGTRKVGHAGTLDPMATGLLVIGFGAATRLLAAIVAHDKTYEATIRLGLATTTDDAEGAVVPPAAGDGAVAGRVAGLDRSAVASAIAAGFLGDIEQVPNAYSAIKVDGRRAYDLARDGREVTLAARPVHIAAFDVLDARRGVASRMTPGLPLGERGDGEPADAPMAPVLDVDVRVSCSSGTYIRALARDLGAALGVGGHLVRLRRTRVGGYALADDRSGLVDADAVADAGRHVVTARTATKAFRDREGTERTRAMCVLDVPGAVAGDRSARADWLRGRALTMGEAVRGALPVIAISAVEAADLRHGRRIACDWAADPRLAAADQAAALVPGGIPAGGGRPAQDDVVALVAPAGGGAQAKPTTVFPAA